MVFYLSLVAQTAQEEEGARGWLGWLTCWVVARQYSAVLRMLQMRQSSYTHLLGNCCWPALEVNELEKSLAERTF